MPGISRISDFLTLGNGIANIHKRTVLSQMIVLTGCAIAVQNHDEVGIPAAAIFPATPGMGLLDVGDYT